MNSDVRSQKPEARSQKNEESILATGYRLLATLE